MAIQQQQTGGDLTLRQAIEMVAKDKGIDKARLVKTVEEAILKAAQSVFGPNRELEARFNEESGQVDLFQYMTIVDDVADDDREIAMEDAQRLGLEAEMGEELGFQIFWHPTDAKKALGRALFGARDYQGAANEFEAVIDRAPTNDFALFCLGRSLQMLGRHAEARKPLALAACMEPSRRDYRIYRDRARARASAAASGS